MVRYKAFINKKAIAIVTLPSIFLGIAILYALYQRNPASVQGRFLTYQVMLNMITQRPWCGWGTEAIPAHYMAAQANFLQQAPNMHHYAWLANDVVRPFNEMLSTLLCYGVIGILLMALALFLVWKNSSISSRARLLPLLIAWITLGTCSYPSYYPYALFLLVGGCGVNCSTSASFSILSKLKIPLLAFALLGVFASVYQVKQANTQEVLLNKYTQATNSVESPLPPSALKHDVDLLYALAVIFNLDGQPQKSQQLLTQLRGHLQNYDTELLAGDNALTLHQYVKAVQHFNLAHSMVPVRFMPLYGLMQTHLQQGDTLKACMVAHDIVNKRIKVKSADVADIKTEAQILLKKCGQIKSFEK